MTIGAKTVFAGASAQNIVKVPLHITRNDEVKTSVVVVVHPGGTRHPARAADTRRRGHVCEGTVTIVVVQRTASVSGYIEVFKSVVVVVPHGHSRGIAISGETSFFSHVLKCAIGFLMIEPVPVLRTVFPGNRAFQGGIVEPRAIGEKDIQASVIIVIEQGDARAHRLQEVFLAGCRSLLAEVNAELFRDIDEMARRRA